MERVKTFVQKIQEIYYSKHPKSAIDIDLMLDYTRVMYMDLLEWRKAFSDPIHSDMPAIMQDTPKSPEENDAVVPAPIEEQQAQKEEPTINENEEMEASEEVEDTITNEKQEALSAASTEAVAEDSLHQEAVKEEVPELVSEFPEEQSIAAIAQERTGISFEAPAPAETLIEIEDVLVEEAPVETNVAVEVPAPAPAEIPLPQMKAFEPPRLFDSIVETKDIRTSIGINDKYLFLNELFNNHKSYYEETLDSINRAKTLGDATGWVKTRVAAASHWDNNDPTVQSFYALVEKHFSPR